MSALWTGAEAQAATGGRLVRDFTATGVSIDTRSLQPGDLFVALSDRRDGHDFVARALEKGAAAALVARVPQGVGPDAPLLIVPDVLAALRALAGAARARFGGRVVAVTGSVGKTSTKEMLRVALAGQGRVHAAEASFNNHWGVPLTLARLPRAADFAVVEIGMNHAGETAPLARLARPHVGLITTIAAAHLEAFDGIEAIAREKASLFEGLMPGGTGVVNGDLAVTPILCAAARAVGAGCLTFGESAGCDFRLTALEITGGLTLARAERAGTAAMFKLSSAGRHFALNALGTLAAVSALGGDLALAACDLAAWQPPAGRGTRETVVLDAARQGIGFELIDDAFNANPTSMAAALAVLAQARPRDGLGQRHRGRRIAVLGDMLELGPKETAMHAALGDLDSLRTLDLVHCVGPRMRALWQILPEHQRGEYHASAADLAARAHRLVDAGDIVLVKGSKGAEVSRVVDALRKLGHRGAGDKKGRV